MAIDGETDNVSRHRDTGCDGLKTFFPSPLSCLPRPSEAETFPAWLGELSCILTQPPLEFVLLMLPLLFERMLLRSGR